MVEISSNSALKSFLVGGWVAQLIIVSLQVLLFENTIQIQNFECFLWPFLNMTMSETCVGPMWDLYGTKVGPVWDWRPEWTWSLTILSAKRLYYRKTDCTLIPLHYVDLQKSLSICDESCGPWTRCIWSSVLPYYWQSSVAFLKVSLPYMSCGTIICVLLLLFPILKYVLK